MDIEASTIFFLFDDWLGASSKDEALPVLLLLFHTDVHRLGYLQSYIVDYVSPVHHMEWGEAGRIVGYDHPVGSRGGHEADRTHVVVVAVVDVSLVL